MVSDYKMTTAKVSKARWLLFQHKVLKDKAMYFQVTKKKMHLSVPTVVNAFMWGIVNKKFKVDLTFGAIKDADFVVGITLDKGILMEMKKYVIDYESVNFVPHPTGISGVISRIVEQYSRMDWREVSSKVLEWEKEVKK